MIVDISKAAAEVDSSNRQASKKQQRDQEHQPVESTTPRTAPIGASATSSAASATTTPFGTKRAILQHQSSLSASASAAVDEARKYLGNKLSQLPEANLRNAKDMVLAAASHLDSRVKFRNLRSDDNFDDDDEEDSDSEVDEDDDYDERTTNAAESTTVDDEDDEDDDGASSSDFGRASYSTPKSKHKRSQSILSSALSSYKKKQRGGYQKALNEDDEDEEEEDDDERTNLNRSALFKGAKKASLAKAGADSSGPPEAGPVSGQAGKFQRQATAPAGLLEDESNTNKNNNLVRSNTSVGRQASKGSKKARGSTKRASKKKERKVLAKYEEEDEDLDAESGQRTFRCLDNSVSLLYKTRLEDTILRCAVGAVLLAACGLFILLSLPPALPPKEVVDILIKT